MNQQGRRGQCKLPQPGMAIEDNVLGSDTALAKETIEKLSIFLRLGHNSHFQLSSSNTKY